MVWEPGGAHPWCLKHLCFTRELQRDLGELELIPARNIPQDNTRLWLEMGGKTFLVGGEYSSASSWKSGLQEAAREGAAEKCLGGTPELAGVTCGSAGDKIPRV